MNVENALAGFAVRVEDGAVPPVCVSALFRDYRRAAKQRADERVVLWSEIVQRGNVRFRYDQNVERRLRVDVFDDHELLVFVHPLHRNFAREHSAEKTTLMRFAGNNVRGMSCRS